MFTGCSQSVETKHAIKKTNEMLHIAKKDQTFYNVVDF